MISCSDGNFEGVIRTEWPKWDAKALPQPLINVVNGVTSSRFCGKRIAVEITKVADLYFLRGRALTAVDTLSLRERQIAEHFGAGRSHKQIATLLHISPTTVRNHLQNIYSKLGVGDKAELARVLVKSV